MANRFEIDGEEVLDGEVKPFLGIAPTSLSQNAGVARM